MNTRYEIAMDGDKPQIDITWKKAGEDEMESKISFNLDARMDADAYAEYEARIVGWYEQMFTEVDMDAIWQVLMQ